MSSQTGSFRGLSYPSFCCWSMALEHFSHNIKQDCFNTRGRGDPNGQKPTNPHLAWILIKNTNFLPKGSNLGPFLRTCVRLFNARGTLPYPGYVPKYLPTFQKRMHVIHYDAFLTQPYGNGSHLFFQPSPGEMGWTSLKEKSHHRGNGASVHSKLATASHGWLAVYASTWTTKILQKTVFWAWVFRRNFWEGGFESQV